MSPSTLNSMIEDLIYFHNQFANKTGYTPCPQKSDVQYPMNLKYNKDRMIFEYYVAGIPKEDLSVEVEEDRLIVCHDSTKTPQTKEMLEDMFSYTTLIRGATEKDFRHVWKINPIFDMEQIQVVHYNGMLSIIIPRIPEKKKIVKSLTF